VLDLHRIRFLGEHEALDQPLKVRVHRQPRHAERVAAHHVRRLAAHARKRHQILEFGGHFPAEIRHQLLA